MPAQCSRDGDFCVMRRQSGTGTGEVHAAQRENPQREAAPRRYGSRGPRRISMVVRHLTGMPSFVAGRNFHVRAIWTSAAS
jgi:hypothetical protein